MRFMKETRTFSRRLLSLVLAILMLISLTPAVLALELEDALAEPLPEEPSSAGDPVMEEPADQEALLPPEDSSNEEPPAGETPDEDTSVEEETILPEEPSLPEEEEPVLPAVDGADLPADEEEPTAGTRLAITEMTELALEYDDRYSFGPDWEILTITSDEITSYQVNLGKKTSLPDFDVVLPEGDSLTDIIATGTGTATILLAPADRADEVRALLSAGAPVLSSEELSALTEEALLPEPEAAEPALEESGSAPEGDEGTGSDPDSEKEPLPEEPVIDTIGLQQVTVTVTPARLAMFVLAGQSNLEGFCANTYRPQDSVLCPEGEVYSTYAGKDSSVTSITGISNFFPCTVDTINSLVPSNLTGTTSLAGTELVYPLDALTGQGKGKTGPDAALAYEWNRLTGEKVWTVNCAYSGSQISHWVSGGSVYERNRPLLARTTAVYNAEIAAGHYTAGSRVLFWMQGEYETCSSVSAYVSKFKSVQTNLSNICGTTYTAMIAARNYNKDHVDDTLDLSIPRIAQYYMGNSPSFPTTYVISNVNEQWETNAGIADYFGAAYPSGQPDYPLRANTTLTALPSTTLDIHDNLHFSQIAHNENGLDAARNLYHVIFGGSSESISVTWRNARYTEVSEVTVSPKKSAVLVPVVYPLYRSKEVTIRSSSSKFPYNAATGTVTASGSGSAVLTAYARGSALSSVTVSVSGTATPVLKSINVVSGGIKITWSGISGASSYYVYRKTEDSNWTRIGAVSGTSYTDTAVEDSVYYTYTVRAVKNGSLSGFDTKGLSLHYITPPTLTVSNAGDGILLTWSSSPIAPRTWIYRRIGNGPWQRILNIPSSVTSYVDKSVNAGTQYSYYILSVLGISYSTSATHHIVRLPVPALTRITNDLNAVRLQWGKVSGASAYLIYRKTADSDWSYLARVTGGSTVTYYDRTVENGTAYTYTVRALRGNHFSDYHRTGLSISYLETPSVTRVYNSTSGITLNWTAIEGAEGYQLYRRLTAGSANAWELIGSVTDGAQTSYTDLSPLVSGTSYTYTVRAVSSVTRSHFTAGASVVRLDTPILTAIGSRTGYVTLSWKKVTGASGYTVYRRTADSNWSTLGSVTGGSTLTYSDRSVTGGTGYIYTVRARYKNSALSDFDPDGISTTYLATPVLKSVSNVTEGLALSWDPVAGAEGYYIYRRLTAGSASAWEHIDTLTDGTLSSYVDTDPLISGTGYTYTLRAISSGGNSHFNSGRGTVRLDTPVLRQAANYAAFTTVSWQQVPGAAGYRIYRRTPDSGWTTLASVSGVSTLSYKDTKVTSGTTYLYTVRAYQGGTLSYFDTDGLHNLFLAPPVISSTSSEPGGMEIRWTPLAGAAGYRIYRKTSSSGWIQLADVEGGETASWLDTSELTTGLTYTYTIRALTENNMSYFTPGKATLYVRTPTQLSAIPTDDGILVTWEQIDGADGYRVYRRPSSGNWKFAATVSGGSATGWTDTALLDPNETYYYTVRAYRGSSLSGFDTGTPVAYPQ